LSQSSDAKRATVGYFSPTKDDLPLQGDNLSGKTGNVRDFDSRQGNVRDFTKSQGNVRENILSGKSGLKLFIVSCIFASVQVFSSGLFCVKY